MYGGREDIVFADSLIEPLMQLLVRDVRGSEKLLFVGQHEKIEALFRLHPWNYRLVALEESSVQQVGRFLRVKLQGICQVAHPKRHGAVPAHVLPCGLPDLGGGKAHPRKK